MKFKTQILAAAFFLAFSAHAQLKYGPRIGFGSTSLGGGTGSVGFQAGLFINAELKDRMGLQPEVLFTMKNGSETVDGFTNSGQKVTWKRKYSFTYIDIPLYIYLPVSKHLTVLFGPQMAIVNKATSKLTGQGVTGTEGERKDVAADSKSGFAAGLDIHSSSPLRFGIRYSSTGGQPFKGQSSFIAVTAAYIMDW